MDRIASNPEDSGRLKVLHIAQLPPGWLGKVHAMWSAANQATGDWLLFTDADVLFRPDVLNRALAYAESESADHVVLLPRIIMKNPGERMTIAFFQTLFVFGHRPWKVADPKNQGPHGSGCVQPDPPPRLRRRRHLPGTALRSSRRHEAGQDREKRRLCAEKRLRRQLDFAPLGERRHGNGAEISPRISLPSCRSSGGALCCQPLRWRS